MFPVIEHLDDLLPHVRDKDEIKVTKQPNGYIVASYLLAGPETFNNPYALECRGITFKPDGTIAARPLHKFFNLGEREHTQKHLLDWTQVKRVMDKRDGSMINPVVINGDIVCKSKKTFESDVALQATQFIKDRPDYQAFILYCDTMGWTPTFEWTTPRARIVLNYLTESLTLLHVRDNITGEYFDIKEFGRAFDIPIVDDYTENFDIDQTLSHLETAEKVEGVIVQFNSGDMVKIKAPWYLALHHAVTFPRERDIAEMVLDERLDDYLSYLNQVGADQSKVLEIEDRVLKDIVAIQNEVTWTYEENKHLDRKTFAITLKDHQYFGMIMTLYTGKEPDYNDYYRKYHLKEKYNLEQI